MGEGKDMIAQDNLAQWSPLWTVIQVIWSLQLPVHLVRPHHCPSLSLYTWGQWSLQDRNPLRVGHGNLKLVFSTNFNKGGNTHIIFLTVPWKLFNLQWVQVKQRWWCLDKHLERLLSNHQIYHQITNYVLLLLIYFNTRNYQFRAAARAHQMT